jgi:predicted DNA-binding transcriptional regulator YafY
MRGRNLVKLLTAINLICRPQGASIEELETGLMIKRRAVYNLLNMMEYDLNFPIYNVNDGTIVRKKFGETFLQKLPNMNIPNLNLTLAEILSLYFLRGNEGIFRGTEISKTIKSSFQKLDAFLPEGLAAKLKGIKSLFISSARFAKDYSGKEEILGLLTESMLQMKTCQVSYYSFLDAKIKEFRIDPLHFFERDGGLYIFVNATDYADIRTLALERIQSIRKSEQSFTYPDDFDPDSLLEEAFSFIHDDPINAKIRFSASQGRYIKERRWGKKQVIIENPDGSIMLEIATSGREDLERWVLSFGDDAEILEPQDFRSEITAKIKSMAEIYK